MGPVQTKYLVGRGDKYMSARHTLDVLIKKDLDTYIVKYNKLDANAKAELQALFDDEDVGELLADEYVKEMAEMFLTSFINNEDMKNFLDAIYTFIDEHPVELTPNEIRGIEAMKQAAAAKGDRSNFEIPDFSFTGHGDKALDP